MEWIAAKAGTLRERRDYRGKTSRVRMGDRYRMTEKEEQAGWWEIEEQ